MSLNIRQKAIYEYLKEHKYAKVSALGEMLYVSVPTIRRELNDMERLGLVERQRGDVTLLETNTEINLQMRYEKNTLDKQATAEIALKKLPDFKTAFIDNSSTAYIFTKKANLSLKTVITNSLSLAMELSKKKDITVIMPGGTLLYNSNELQGSPTIRFFSDLNLDLMISSCAGISTEGTFERSLEQAELKRAVMQRCKYKILLVDKTKLTKSETYRVAELSEYDAIFTNAEEDALISYRLNTVANIINK